MPEKPSIDRKHAAVPILLGIATSGVVLRELGY
jgi:hypothetical protein